MNYYEIGQRIRKYRKAYNLSQEQLAESVNISATHMSHIETGNTKLSLPVLAAIADALSVTVDELLYDKANESKMTLTNEITNILNSCTNEEMHVMIDIIKSVKSSLNKYMK